ncbi:Wzz/FepE/Etk N-terminal domain-containing protein [Thermodesulfovibrio sp. 3907-1M]|uniref:Wzz/FepE/Etk N-terminal domain-containing protein n=1 Tax=Thermodesulfovibrio autotrophicus TaxID=3118333 RepID=A0AAU8GZD5_9BACT
MNVEEIKEKYSDEIDLYELILILKKRIKYVAGVFVLGVFVAAVVSFIMPNIYQARATLWVDSFITQAMIENLKANQFVRDSKLSFIIPLQQGRSLDATNLSLSILYSAEFQKKLRDKVRQTYGSGVVPSFKADIDKKTGSIVFTSEQRDRKLAEEILKTAIEEFRTELDKASLAFSEVIASEKVKTDKSKNFFLYVIENPNSSETPVKPKRKLIIALAAVSSLFAGVFLAFLVEWWSKAKRGGGDSSRSLP